MSATFCRVCKTSVNVANCCGRPTDLDEFYARDPVFFPVEISLEEMEAQREANRAMVHPPSIFEKMDVLRESIENLGWDAFRLQKSGEIDRSKNLLAVVAAKENELRALVAERRKCL